jgi:ABC-2 type transport system permease protein
MNLSIILALLSRYLLLYGKNPVRLFELFFWPIVQLLMWGFVTVSLQKQGSGHFPNYIAFLIGAIILWDALFRSQQAVAVSFLEDVWTRNLLNIFAAPVRMSEYLAATFGMGILRVAITGVVLGVIAISAYSFNLLQFQGSLLVVWYANLMLFGWSLGILSIALIVRWGHGAESLAWAMPFMIQPFAAVFYPVSTLPHWMRGVALAMPPAHIFEGMRDILAGRALDRSALLIACGLNVLYLTVSCAIFGKTLAYARERGLLVKVATS